MDIDCDGANHSAGKCADDPSGQPDLAFDSQLQSYNVGLQHLDAHIHPYVVLGNSGGSPSFGPANHGVHPLSLVAVVCNGALVSLVSYKNEACPGEGKLLMHMSAALWCLG